MRGATAFAALVLIGAAASAQTVPSPQREEAQSPAAPAAVTPPQLQGEAVAEYPASRLAERIATQVVLEIVIDATGAVAEARVTGVQQPGFDDSALSAARGLRFTPARQGEQPIPVRIQFAFNFPPPQLPAPAAPSEKPVNLAGTVRERGTRKKLSGIEVLVPAADLAAVTDQNGRFELRGVPEGPQEIVIAAAGYQRYAVTETVAAGEKLEVLYRIEPLFANPLEAIVEGERQRKELSKTSLSNAETQRIPGAQGDALKVIEDLPGVARTSPIGGGLLVIRGSKPGDSLVFLDGEPIPLLYHFAALSSTVNPDLLEGIDLLPGNFSAYYGDMTGGLIDVRSRKLREEPHGYANISLLDTSALLEAKVPGVDGLSFAVAGRRSYFDVFLRAALKGTDIGLSVAPVYYDGQFRLDYKPAGSAHSFQLLALTSNDELGLLFKRPLDSDPNVSGSFDVVTGFSQLRLKHGYRSGRFSLDTVGMFERINLKFDVGPQFFTLEGYDFFLRSTAVHELSDELTLAAGFEAPNRRARVGARFASGLNVREGELNQNAPPRPDDALIDSPSAVYNRFSPGLWGEARYRPLPRLSFVAGLRADAFKYSTYPDAHVTFSPRLAARYQLSDELALKGGVGLYTEGARNGDAAREFGNPAVLPERAFQTTAGLEARPAPGVLFTFEGYYKYLDQIISRTDATEVVDGKVVPSLLANTGVGRVYGIEVLLRRELSERFFGWLAYSLSRSDRIDRPGAARRLFDFDQTHALTLIASYKLPRGWQFGGRFRLISGNPETPVTGARYLASADVYLPIFGAANSERLPLFHQLDLRVDKVWTFDAWSLDLFLDVVNAYNHRSDEGSLYSYDYSQRGYFRGLPVLPSLGVKGSF